MKNVFLLFFCLFSSFCLTAQESNILYDVSYGVKPHQKLNIFKSKEANQPVVIIIPGGQWKKINKDSDKLLDVARVFKNKGYTAVIIEYISSLDTTYKGYPNQLCDLSTAIDWVKDNGDLLHGDTGKIFLFGTSAGAYLAAQYALLADNGVRLQCSNKSLQSIQGVIALSGVYDFSLIPKDDEETQESLNWMLKDQLLKKEEAEPIKQIGIASKTRYLLVHGGKDFSVGPLQATNFHQCLQENGYCSNLLYLKNRYHNIIGPMLRNEDNIKRNILLFLQRTIYKQDCQFIENVSD